MVLLIVLAILVGVPLLIILFGSPYNTEEQTRVVIERWGRFHKIAQPGFGLKIPIADQIVDRPSLRTEQLEMEVQTKTKDDVFVTIKVAVQKRILEDKVKDAVYKLENPDGQMQTYVFDVVRSQVPSMDLDDVFAKKDEIAKAVQSELSAQMAEFGYVIDKVLVTDIDPDEKVRDAMNEIQAETRLRKAAEQKGEAAKILRVKEAEAESESKRLQGEGIAAQRQAIIHGLKASVDELKGAVGDEATGKEVMNLVLITQYLDTLKEIGTHGKGSTLMMPYPTGGADGVLGQLSTTLLGANLAGAAHRKDAANKDKGGEQPSQHS